MARLVYGIAVQSDIDLDLGLPVIEDDARVTIRRLDEALVDDEVAWHDTTTDDDPWESGRIPGGPFVLRYGDVADLTVSLDGTAVGWWAPEAPPALMAHLIADHALPQALMRQGNVVLHASCLVTPGGRCYALAGESGRGKSTLAAEMAQRGHRFLSDDCTVIDLSSGAPIAAPAYPGIRLHPDSPAHGAGGRLAPAGPVSEDGDKMRLALTDDHWDGRVGAQLTVIMTLGPASPRGRGPRRVPPAQAITRLLGHSFHVAEAGERVELFDRMATLVDMCPVTELHYEHTQAGLMQATSEIQFVIDSWA